MAYVTRLSEILHGSLTPQQILWELSYADGIRLLNQWYIDSDETGKARLVWTGKSGNLSIKGLF